MLSQKNPSLLQSSRWATIKKNWTPFFYGIFTKDNQLVSSMLIFKRKLIFGFSILYIPQGPFIDYYNKTLFDFLTTSLKKLAKQEKALWVTIDPHVPISYLQQHHTNETTAPFQFNDMDIDANHLPMFLHFLDNGWKWNWSKSESDMNATINPRTYAVLKRPKNDKLLLQHFSKKIQSRIKNAAKKLTIKQGNSYELLNDFTTLMNKTANRKQISLRNGTYYANLLRAYHDQAYITIAYLNIEKQINHLNNQMTNLLKRLSKTENPAKYKNILDELIIISKQRNYLLNKYHDMDQQSLIPVAGTLTVNYGTISENLYAGMDEDFSKYNPALLVWYETAKSTFDQFPEIQTHNLGGIENDLKGGLFTFKSHFNPTIVFYPGEFELITHRFHSLAKHALKLRNQFHNFLNKNQK